LSFIPFLQFDVDPDIGFDILKNSEQM